MVAVILVEPKHSGNIGSVARVMKNFGFSDLVLVNPCKLTEDSKKMAMHAQDVLEKSKTVKTFDDLDFDLLIGTSSKATPKDDYFLRMAMDPNKLREKLETVQGKIGLIFGREDSGLTNEELEKCDFLVNIPTSKEYKAMNLSHAVSVILYELNKAEKGSDVRLASKIELELVKEQFKALATAVDYPSEKRKAFNTMIEKIIGRALITGREANTLIGVLKQIKGKLRCR
jgi:TrmH family RNA methyltransferase